MLFCLGIILTIIQLETVVVWSYKPQRLSNVKIEFGEGEVSFDTVT